MGFFEELISEIESTGQPSGEVWFRGQADGSWDLVPWLLRAGMSQEQEKNMLARFRYRAMAMLADHPADTDAARWLFLMQHHGLPTRLLDWTESALAGLFFALDGEPDTDGSLYMLTPMELNKQQAGERALIPPTASPCDEMMHGCFKATKQPEKIVAIGTYASNDRLARQRGGFTVHGTAQDLREVATDGYLRSISIPASLKAQLRETLAHLGVTRTSLFHDLDALSRELREQYGVT